ncbi:PIN domain-containing protein [Micromonospora sp. NPDC047707]|uniref:PIN domain-containing protein n=1 Tax=Micromonospora sp. NPDC047707 TaxID=3154498 RepID=UPI003455F475
MLITPLPGVSLKDLSNTLGQLRNYLSRVHVTGPGRATERAQQYLEWVNEARRMLRTQLRPAELEQLLPTQEYELTLSAIASSASVSVASHGNPDLANERLLNGLVSTQIDQRSDALQQAIDSLDAAARQFERAGVLVVLDTGVFLRHPQKLEEMDLAPVLGLRDEPIHIVVPMPVVDQLDGLKQHHKQHNRWRAGYSTAVIERVLRQGGLLREEDYSALTEGGIPRGRVTLDVLLDPPGHVRLPITDDEIVDRAVAVKVLAGRDVRLVTYDTGMAMRGNVAGLVVVKLEQELGEEPK